MYKHMNLLESKKYIATEEFLNELEILNATFKRDLAVLRDWFDVPLVYNGFFGAYKLDQKNIRRRLPGVWFSVEEIQAVRNILNQCLTEKIITWRIH